MSIDIKEKKAVQELFPFLGEKPLIIDVGSNKGFWADIFLEEYSENCEIHLFEPNPIFENYYKIKYDYNKNVSAWSTALSNRNGKFIFYYFENENNGLSSLYNNRRWDYLPKKQTEVYCAALDTMEDFDYIDFIKIDVEGSEFDVLEGMQNLLEKGEVRFIQVEYSEHYKVSNTSFTAVLKMMEGYGYSAYTFDGEFHKIDSKTFVEDYHAENFILTKHLIENQQNWNGEFIKNTKELGKFDLVLEVGVFEGLTTKYICENMLNEGGRVVAVDPLEDYYREPNDIPYFKDQYYRFMRNTKGLLVNLIRKKSDEAFPELLALRFDFCYIDADHSADQVYRDASNAFDVTKIEGYILIDDVNWGNGETKKGIDEFLYRVRARHQILKIGEQILIKKLEDYY